MMAAGIGDNAAAAELFRKKRKAARIERLILAFHGLVFIVAPIVLLASGGMNWDSPMSLFTGIWLIVAGSTFVLVASFARRRYVKWIVERFNQDTHRFND